MGRHLFFTAQYRNIRKKRQAYASSSSRRSSLIMVSALDIALGFGFAERKTKKAWDLGTEDILAGMTPDVLVLVIFIESLPLSAATQRQRWIYPNSFYIPDNFIVIVLYFWATLSS